MSRWIFPVVLLSFVLNLSFVVADDAKSFEMLDVELVKSGVLIINGSVREVNLFLYVPQESLESMQVTPSDWTYVKDKFGNRMVKIHWTDHAEVEKYEVRMHVVNYAKHYEDLKEEKWELENETKKQTNLTSANEEIMELAYGNETILEKAVRLSIWINKNMKYDLQPLKEKTESAQWTFENRRGVCGEYSNLLASMLRSQSIPVRYVVGYAFPQVSFQIQNEPWMHAWVEVLIDNRWVPFDPTWLEGGFLDATHIKFANLLDSSFSERVSWVGEGRVDWVKDNISFRMLDSLNIKNKLELDVKDSVSAGKSELGKGVVNGKCSLVRLDLGSCVDENEKPIFEILDPRRDFWFCNEEDVYWIFNIDKYRENYICPIVLYGQDGARAQKKVTVAGRAEAKNIFIEGPEEVAVGESLYIKTERSGTFFSPNFTGSVDGDDWNLDIKKSGTYVFYFYSDGFVGKKIINVLNQKEIQFLSVEKPKNVTAENWFLLNVTAKNMLGVPLPTLLKINFENQTFLRSLQFNPYEEKTESFNITAHGIGAQKLLITNEGKTLSSYSVVVDVIENQTFTVRLEKFVQILIDKIKAFLYRIGIY